MRTVRSKIRLRAVGLETVEQAGRRSDRVGHVVGLERGRGSESDHHAAWDRDAVSARIRPGSSPTALFDSARGGVGLDRTGRVG